MFANRPYIIPKPPAKETYFKILRDFYIVESISLPETQENKFFFIQLAHSQTVNKQQPRVLHTILKADQVQT